MNRSELHNLQLEATTAASVENQNLPWREFGVLTPEPMLVKSARELRLQFKDPEGNDIVGSTELAHNIFEGLIKELRDKQRKTLIDLSSEEKNWDEVSGFVNYSTEKLVLYEKIQPAIPKHIFTTNLPPLKNWVPVIGKIEIDFDDPFSYVGVIAIDDWYRANGGEGIPFVAILRSIIKDLGIAGTIPNAGAVPYQILYNELAQKYNQPLVSVSNSSKAFYNLSNDWNYNWEGSHAELNNEGFGIVDRVTQYYNPIGVDRLKPVLGLLSSGSIKRSTFDMLAGAAEYYRILSDESIASGLVGHRHVPNIPEELALLTTGPFRKVTAFGRKILGFGGEHH
jgi:hypothetical protein